MKGKTLFICLVLVSALVVGIAVTSTDLFRKGENMKEKEPETNVSWVIASEDPLLGKYEKSDKLFRKDVGRYFIVYTHQRMIDGVIVKGDFIKYVFDKNTKELEEKIIYWYDDFPEHIPEKIIPKEQAESIAGGGSATLYFISPKSHGFKIKQTKNPCWVVWKTVKTDKYDGPYYNITVVDAIEGKILGYGIPPP